MSAYRLRTNGPQWGGERDDGSPELPLLNSGDLGEIKAIGGALYYQSGEIKLLSNGEDMTKLRAGVVVVDA